MAPDELDLPTARWLTSPDGLAAVAGAVARLDAAGANTQVAGRRRSGRSGGSGRSDASLAAAAWARDRWPEQGRAAAVVAAAVARRGARGSWPHADELLFTRTALEQASDPVVSAWRAARLAAAAEGAGRTWDLCAGIGGDALAIARASGRAVHAVDRDASRLELLRHNAGVLGVEVVTEEADALAVRTAPHDVVHADPSRRRADGRRVRRLAEHLPPVGALLAVHARTAGRAVVLSPGVDLDDPDLPADAELEFVAVDGQLVEAVVWSGALAVPGRAATATLLQRSAAAGDPAGDVSIARGRGPRSALPVGPVGSHLVEVVAAAVRARVHDPIGADIGARRLARRRALLTCDEPPPPSPWYVARPVLAVLPARPRAVRAWLRGRQTPALELAVHGLDADVASWWRALGRPPRGPGGWRIELVRLDDGAVAIVTEV